MADVDGDFENVNVRFGLCGYKISLMKKEQRAFRMHGYNSLYYSSHPTLY